MKQFNHLHCHSTYSLLDGYGLPEQYIEKLKANGQKNFALTDHGSTWGHIDFYFKLKDAGIKPILGCEMYFDPEDATKKNPRRNHITILASNNDGFYNLNKLQTWANKEGFYYKPRIDTNKLVEFGKGLIVLSGCVGSGYPIKTIGANKESLKKWLLRMKKEFGKNFYMEVSPLNHNVDLIQQLIPMADSLKIPIVATSDVHFPNKEDHLAEDIMLTIGLKASYDDPYRMKLMDELYLWSNEEAYKKCKDFFGNRADEFINSASKIAEKCSIDIKPAEPLHFFKNDSKLIKAENEFNRMISDGWKYRKINPAKNKEYRERANYEIGLIKEKKFINYFLIIADLVQWAKGRMLVGSARGSSAGSLVAYLLRITEIDPIKHNLIFERFIDITRKDLPDIDIDFPHIRRAEVIQYLVSKYGSDHVSLLGTLGMFKSKNAIWDVGRIFNMPYETSKELANTIIERSSGDSRASFCIEDSIEENENAARIVENFPEYKIAGKIEGQIRQTGIHAAAVVLSNKPLLNFGSFANINNDTVLCMDKKAAEKCNLLKIDVLALKQLTITENILKQINKPIEWLYNLDIEDKKAYTMLSKKLFQGIFQFEGTALKAVSLQSSPDDFHSMQEISALARPGALHCGGTTLYLDHRAYEKNLQRKTKKKAKYIHPLIKAVTEDTYGVIIYQEQVMKIMRQVGNMSWEDTAKIRRLISKSLGVEYFNQFYEKFKIGAQSNGLKDEEISDVWHQIATFGSWAFNLSHSVSYGYISFWSLYLKAYYPAEFYLCSLQQQTEDDNIKYLLREWVTYFKGKFITLDANKSQLNFSLQEGILYGGFSNIKGLGEKNAEKIIKYRDISPTTEFFRKKIGKKTFEILDQFNAIPEFKSKQASLFSLNEMEPRRKEESKIPYEFAPWADLIPIGEEFRNYYEEFGFTYISDITDDTNKIRLIGKLRVINLRSHKETTVTQKMLHNKEVLKDPHLDKFFNLVIEDDTGLIFIGVNRYKYPEFKNEIYRAKVGGIIIIEGYKIPGFLKIQIKKMKVLKTADEK